MESSEYFVIEIDGCYQPFLKQWTFFVDGKIVSLNEKKTSLLCEEEGTLDLLSFFRWKAFLMKKNKKVHEFELKEKIPP